MHKPKAIVENEKHKILLDFEVQMDHLISVKRPAQAQITKKNKKKKKEKKEIRKKWWKKKEKKKKKNGKK